MVLAERITMAKSGGDGMTSHPLTRSNRLPFLLLCLALAMVFVTYEMSHGEVKHGADSITVRQAACDPSNKIANFERQDGICHIIELFRCGERFGIRVSARIRGEWKSITEFVLRDARTAEDAADSIENSGAVKTWPPIK
jgi:hypothetical protein